MGGKVETYAPIENQKGEIVDTLINMNENMRNFTVDMEGRLE